MNDLNRLSWWCPCGVCVLCCVRGYHDVRVADLFRCGAARSERRAGAQRTLPDPCTAAHGDVPYAALSAIVTVIRVSRNMVIGWDGLAGANGGAASSSTLFLPITEFTAPDARASDPWVCACVCVSCARVWHAACACV